MADDTNKKHQDGWTVSFIQTYEYNYFRDQIKKEFPVKPDDAVNNAILACRKEISPSEGREKLKACLSRRPTACKEAWPGLFHRPKDLKLVKNRKPGRPKKAAT